VPGGQEGADARVPPAGMRQGLPLVEKSKVHDPRPEPRPGQPYLSSVRFTVPINNPKLGKGMLNKVRTMLTELNLPLRPMPTKVRSRSLRMGPGRVCLMWRWLVPPDRRCAICTTS
jgi:hypothetical protein